jgi:hypothetical protein
VHTLLATSAPMGTDLESKLGKTASTGILSKAGGVVLGPWFGCDAGTNDKQSGIFKNIASPCCAPAVMDPWGGQLCLSIV